MSRRSGYDTAQICDSGHVVTSSLDMVPGAAAKFCAKCGSPTATACRSCGSAIRGSMTDSMVMHYETPSYCHECGQPFPWTAERLAALREVLSMSEGDPGERDSLIRDVDALAADTPRTQLAVLKMKKFLARAGGEVGPAVRQILIEVATASAKKSMGL